MIKVIPPNSDTIISRCKTLLSSGGVEDVLTFLKKEGFSSIHAIKALVDLQDLSLQEAQQIVHNSPSWNRDKV